MQANELYENLATKNELFAVRSELKQEITTLRSDFKQKIATLATKMELHEMRSELKKEMSNLDKRILKMTISLGIVTISCSTIMTTIISLLIN